MYKLITVCEYTFLSIRMRVYELIEIIRYSDYIPC